MQNLYKFRYSPRVREAARRVVGPLVGRRRVPGTPFTLRFPAAQHLGMLFPAGMRNSEPELADHMRDWVRPGQTALDIGANIGFYSLLLAHLVGSTGAVHCFEPDPQSSHWLLENIRLNRLDQATPWSVALGAADGVSELHLDLKATTTSSLVSGWDLGLDPHRRQRLMVATARLDSVALNKIDFVKVDVEGAELGVLAGARQTILSARPILLIEVIDRGNIADVVSFLADLDYNVADAKTGAEPQPDSRYSGNIIATPRSGRP